ncbi:hypothetical protein CHS0354_006290 [Potamilus streckersoni]|uniref:Uncharacterized protein n=1 Tax=Potamilus streckersoni TaxID=2493646 RepID=A0AAE0S4U8_9BIVA|nr:hypothetical protein CHS0354_006290 [Potamilus streckersoni]
MASGTDRPGYRQVSDENHATFKIVPSGRGAEDYPHRVTARGECFETVLENNSHLISISNDSASPALDGDAQSLVRSRTPQTSTDQPTSWSQVCESSNLLPYHGTTENHADINKTDVKFTYLSQPLLRPSTPDIRSPIRRNSSSVFNDNVLFGNGSEYFDGGNNQASPPVRQSILPNVFSTTYGYVSPTNSQLYAFSGQNVSFSGPYVLSPASLSPQDAQTARIIPPNNTMIPYYRAPLSCQNVSYLPQSAHISGPTDYLGPHDPLKRFDVPSTNRDQFRPPYSMPVSSLPFNQGVPYPWQSSAYIGPQASSSTSDEQYQRQRTSVPSNPHSARGVSQNAGTVFISQQDQLSRSCLTTTGHNTRCLDNKRQPADEQVIVATDECGRRYKLQKGQVFKPELAQYEVRFQTFVNWPGDSYITPQEAASAGFYLGDESYTRCFACSGGLDHWQPGDNAFKEHAKFYQTCPYVIAVVMKQYLESAGGCQGREVKCVAPGRKPPVETPVATGRTPFDEELNTYFLQLIQMGFHPNRVKLAIQRTLEKYRDSMLLNNVNFFIIDLCST